MMEKYNELGQELIKDFYDYVDKLDQSHKRGQGFNEKDVMWASHLGTILLTLWHPATKTYLGHPTTIVPAGQMMSDGSYLATPQAHANPY